jgi:hypothetical protein
MVEADIRAELIADAGVSAIVSTRIFLKDPIRKEQSNLPFIAFVRQNKARNMVRQVDRFEIWGFSQDTEILENLCNAVINCFEDKRSLNGNPYFSIALVGQTDSREKLDDGYFWSVMTYEFKHTT